MRRTMSITSNNCIYKLETFNIWGPIGLHCFFFNLELCNLKKKQLDHSWNKFYDSSISSFFQATECLHRICCNAVQPTTNQYVRQLAGWLASAANVGLTDCPYINDEVEILEWIFFFQIWLWSSMGTVPFATRHASSRDSQRNSRF